MVNQRAFLGLTGPGVAGAFGRPWFGGTAQGADLDAQNADLVVFNAKVYTVDSGICLGRRRLR